MPTTQIYSNFAEVSLAAYARNLDANLSNINEYKKVDMADGQATQIGVRSCKATYLLVDIPKWQDP